MTLQDTESPVEPAPGEPGSGSAARRGTPPRPPRSGWTDLAGLRPLLLRLHFYAGVFVGPFILLAAVTGLLYTITPQLERAVHADQLVVAVGEQQIPLAEQVARAQQALPGGTITEVRPASVPDATTRVTFDTPDVPQDYQRTVFVDPYTGDVRGTLDTFGEWLPVRAWLDNFHRTLHLGEVGRVYSELAASWLGVLALSGLAIWTVRRRRRRRLRGVLVPQVSGGGRKRLRSWHGAVGVWALAGMLILSATGLTWSQFAGGNVSTLRAALQWSTPSVSSALPSGGGPAVAEDPGVTAQRMLEVARDTGMGGPVAISPPAEPGGAWAVQQVQRSWPSLQDAVAIDPRSDQIVEQIKFEDWPLAAKLARWGIDSHMGLLFGVANQIVLAALALGVICMVVWGYRMWWLRRPTRGGPAGPLGGSSRPGRGAVLVVALVAIGAGVFLPVLGASLMLFLLLDALVLAPRRARAEATAQAQAEPGDAVAAAPVPGSEAEVGSAGRP